MSDQSSPAPSIGRSTWNDAANRPEPAPDPQDAQTSAIKPTDLPTEAATADAAMPVDAPRRARVVAVVNQKGGVGKTTTAVSLAAAVAQAGARVLLVDLDPQGNASSGVGRRIPEGDPSTYGILINEGDAPDITLDTDVSGLRLWGGSLDLAGAEIELVAAFNREHQLRMALEPVRSDHDLVLVDCPPSLGLLTINALVAADSVLVPIQCEYYALEGLEQLRRLVARVQQNLNRSLELGGIVLTMFDSRTNLARDVVQEVHTHFRDETYETIIPRTVRLSEAPSFGEPITVFDPASRGARAYRALAAEIIDRENLPVPPQTTDDEHSDLPTVSGVLAPPPPSAPTPTTPPTDDGDISPWLRVGSTVAPAQPTDPA